MNRVKFVLKKMWYKPKILQENRKINQQKFVELKNNYMKISKRQYHYSHNQKPNMDPNKNNLILLGISLLCLDSFYNKFN